MRKPLTVLVLAAGLGVASLTGCTSSAPDSTPAASSPSTADACAVVRDQFTQFQDELAAAQADAAAGDFSQAVTTWSSLREKVATAADGVSDSSVKDALNDMGTAMEKLPQIFEGVSNGDLTALATKGAEFQEAAAAVQSAGQNLSDVCAP